MKQINLVVTVVMILLMLISVVSFSNTASAADYTPQNVKVCKVSDTSSRIIWTTVDPTNSGLEYSVSGEKAIPKVFNTSLKDHSILLSGLKKGTTYGYAIYIPESGKTTVSATSKTLDQYRQFVAGETNSTDCGEHGGNNYTPKNVKVCKVSDTSNNIFWTTVDPTNSGLEYSAPGEKGVPKVFNTSLKDHSILLSSLKKGTTYGYAIYIPEAGKTTVSATSKTLDQYRQFVAGETHDTGCSKDGKSVTNDDTTPVDTSVGVKCDPAPCDFDRSLGEFFNPLDDGVTVPGLVVRLINILLMLAAMVAVVYIIFGGFQMVTSAGNQTKVAQGKKTVMYAVAGLIVCILSFSIVAVIQSIIS